MQHAVTTFARNEAENYKIKEIETKDCIFKNRLLYLHIQADKNLNKINIYALFINYYQMKIIFCNF